MSLLDGLLRDALLGTSAAVLCLFSLGFVQTRAAEANTIILPPAASGQEGGGRGGPFRGPSEYQLAYDSSLFSSGPGAIEITGVAWRVDGDLGASFDVVVPRFEIWASTFQSPLSELSEIRSENWGADRIIVFLGESVRFVGTASATPNSFDLRVAFDTPFRYDPARGEFLLDIRSSGSFSSFAAWTDVGAAPGAAATMFDDLFGPIIVEGRAEVLEITYIPEPSVYALMGLGAILMWCRKR